MSQNWNGGVRYFDNCSEMATAFSSGEGHYFVDHPEVKKLEAALTERYGMPTIATSHGMTAIMAIVYTLGHSSVVCSRDVYPGTTLELQELNRIGLDYLKKLAWFDPTDPASLKEAIDDTGSKLAIIETIGNSQYMPVADIDELIDVIDDNDCLLVIDSTCTPLWGKLPSGGHLLDVGSLTKFDQPDNEVTGGRISGSQEVIDKICSTRHYRNVAMSPSTARHFNASLHDTAARYDTHCLNATTVAHLCEEHPAVSKTWYPGLESHPGKVLANLYHSSYGGILYVQLVGGERAAIKLCNQLADSNERDWKIAASFGSPDWHLLPFIGTLAKYVKGEGVVRIAPGRANCDPNISALKQALDNLG